MTHTRLEPNFLHTWFLNLW